MKSRIGHYDVLAELGRGGMGVVYKGYEPALDRYVAIKVLAQTLAHDLSIKERFLREARSMASLNDPHIIQIYFIGEDEGQPYFAMEFIDGESLSSYLKREGRLSPQNAAKVIHQTALGLGSAHDKGVIHRDIKPGNLMLTARGLVKIADFGIALSTQDFAKKLTSTGEFVGTPGYLSPEVCTGNPVDQRSDIFSLGIVLFEVLTGRMPFTDESPLGLLLEVVRAEIPDVRELNAEVDPGLVEILRKMTAKDPAQRFASCHELADALSHHPLLAKSGPPSLKVQLSSVSAIAAPSRSGASLPVSKPSNQPLAPVLDPNTLRDGGGATVVTPPPQVAVPAPMAAPTPATAYAAAASAAAPQPSSLNRPARSGAGAFIAIAAVLLLLMVGAGAFALRAKIPFVNAMVAQVAPSLAVPNAPPPPPLPADSGQTPANGGSSAGNGSAPVPPAPPAPPTPPAPNPATGADSSAQALANAAVDAHAQSESGAAANGNASNAANSGAPPRPIAGMPANSDNADPSLQPLRRMAETRHDALLAKASPPEPQTPVRVGPPKVAVVAIGDLAIAGPAQQVLEEALTEQGFLLVDTSMTPGLGHLLHGDHPDLPALLAALSRAHGVRAVTVVRAEPLGSTQLNYYGQSSTLFSANLTVKSYDADSHSPVSAGFMSKVDFTSLNAQSQAREAIEPELRRYVGSLSSYRPKGKGG